MEDNGSQAPREHPMRPESDPIGLSAAEWRKVYKRSGIFKGWFAKNVEGPGGKQQFIVKRAHKAAFDVRGDGILDFGLRDEDIYIAFREVQQGLETALTYKAFSEHAAKVALSGGYNFFMAGLGFGITSRSEEEHSLDKKQMGSKMHISYNIPRVSIFLSESPLRISDELKAWIEKRSEAWHKAADNEKEEKLKQDLPDLIHEFGWLFCFKVLLGGRLHSLQDIESIETDKRKILRDEKKFEMTATVMAPVVGGTLLGSRAKGSDVEKGEKATTSTSHISIECQGGNPLVCCSPSDWMLSVGSSYYWRVIDQDEPENLLSAIQRFENGFLPPMNDYIKALKKFIDSLNNQPQETEGPVKEKRREEEQRGQQDQRTAGAAVTAGAAGTAGGADSRSSGQQEQRTAGAAVTAGAAGAAGAAGRTAGAARAAGAKASREAAPTGKKSKERKGARSFFSPIKRFLGKKR